MKIVPALILVAISAASARADAPKPDAPKGDAARGKAKSVACQACHLASDDYPSLAGQRPAYLARQLQAFKKGDRKSSIMNAIAPQLGDADIADLAAYWASVAPSAGPTDAAAVAKLKAMRLALPKDFPKGFVVYRTDKDDASGTVQTSYANAIAMKAAAAGAALPDGSAIVVVTTAGDTVKGYSEMESRAGWGADYPELVRNGDWSYALFTADKHARTDVNQAVCLACHLPAAKTSYVFGYDHLVAKAKAK